MSKLTKVSDNEFELEIKDTKITLNHKELLSLRKDISDLAEIQYYDKNYNPVKCSEVKRIGENIKYNKFIT